MEIRCTYGAFGKLTDTSARSVAEKHLGEKRPEASWVVNNRTNKPTGYLPEEMHPNLFSNKAIITTGEELSRGIIKPTLYCLIIFTSCLRLPLPSIRSALLMLIALPALM